MTVTQNILLQCPDVLDIILIFDIILHHLYD